MRVVRIALGLPFALVGLLLAIVAGVVGFVLIGPDDTIWSSEQRLSTPGPAAISAPELIHRHGPLLQISARPSDGQRELFVGVARDLDVASYLKDVRHLKIDRIQLPMQLGGNEVNREAGAVTPPAGLDWWVARGGNEVSWPIADGPYDVVVMNADGKPALDAQVKYGVELPGAFVTTLLVAAAGLLLLVVGLVLLFRRPTGDDATAGTPETPAVRRDATAVRRDASAVRRGAVGAREVVQREVVARGVVRRGGGVRRGAGALGTTILMLSATSCAAVAERDTVTALSRPATTAEAGRAEVRRYLDVFASANRTRDEALITTVEGGPLLAQTRASFQIGKALRKPVLPPFSYTRPLIAAPDHTGYPMRFVVSSGVSTDQKIRQLGVWHRQNAGSPWLLTHSVRPAAVMPIPDLAGLRVPSPADNAAALNAATDLAAYLSKGVDGQNFLNSPDLTELLRRRAAEQAKDLRDVYIAGVTDTFTLSGEPVAFVTTSAEVLVFAAFSERYLQTIRLGEAAKWARGDVTAFSNGKEFTRTLSYDMLYQIAFVVPPKGNGKVRILSVDSQLTGAGGS
ncbi:hypothetical protein [Kribbella deserti]|uniref:DUF8094 domain-containing protein n=1 Tax=Kribbella deserti TaxID=1926257 RepID=A0ABV6QJD5_9ACTN